MKTIGNKTLTEMLPQIKKVARKHNLKTYKAKDFKKIMKLLGMLLLMVSCNSKKNRILDDSITTVKDMKEWMIQDQQNEIIDYDYAEYYIEYLDKVEKNLIEIDGI
ncbi:MAG: hypothetical protein CMJ25_30885 [Phycisphaerae bacterium]|nr:hypothetical protein [Phycisphaerae bacterium]|tara:strand:+ start:9877 stop:10194 length:318 start_codon:yes stop_codon:yes gene_type:complete